MWSTLCFKQQGSCCSAGLDANLRNLTDGVLKEKFFLVKAKFLCHNTQLLDDYFTWNLLFLARGFSLLLVLLLFWV